MLGDPVSVSARTASRFGHPGHRGHRGGDLRASTTARSRSSTSVWHQVLTRESGRHLEVFCEGAALWTDDDYLGPLHVQTSDGAREVVGELPDWAGLLTVPEVYAKSIAHYGAAAKALPRRARRSGRRRPTAGRRRRLPGRGARRSPRTGSSTRRTGRPRPVVRP